MRQIRRSATQEMICPQCKYTHRLDEEEVTYGMLCPQCHCGLLKRREQPQPGAWLNPRLAAVRLIVAGAICLAALLVLILAPWDYYVSRVAAFLVLATVVASYKQRRRRD